MTRDAGGPGADEQLDGPGIFAGLARAGRFRDEETAEHVERMSRSCSLIAAQLGWSPHGCSRLRTASALHDIGKIGIPDAVLLKPGPLTTAERAIVERHPEIGCEILAGSSDPVMQLAGSIALTHHERIDGTGYPAGLRGAEIPLPGRIAAVADVFDALTRDRIYRPALPLEEALSILRSGRGTQFDPNVLDAFEKVLPSVLEIGRRFPDSSPHLRGASVAVIPSAPGRAVVLRRPSVGRQSSLPGGAEDAPATARRRGWGGSAHVA